MERLNGKVSRWEAKISGDKFVMCRRDYYSTGASTVGNYSHCVTHTSNTTEHCHDVYKNILSPTPSYWMLTSVLMCSSHLRFDGIRKCYVRQTSRITSSVWIWASASSRVRGFLTIPVFRIWVCFLWQLFESTLFPHSAAMRSQNCLLLHKRFQSKQRVEDCAVIRGWNNECELIMLKEREASCGYL